MGQIPIHFRNGFARCRILPRFSADVMQREHDLAEKVVSRIAQEPLTYRDIERETTGNEMIARNARPKTMSDVTIWTK
ncbi:hypothetical protein TNCV_1219321 [Trichonephila clavipes]|nr:hypothetical protein TNCV_1219321 [Trichonephila clavipes]